MLLRPRRLLFVLVAIASLSALVWQSGRTQSPLRRITDTAEEGTSINPSMSGDGRIVAFESTEDIAGAGGFEHFRAIRANVSVDPPTFMQIGASRSPAPATSQDGSRIAFASKDNPFGTNSDANSEIFLYDGAKLIQVTNTSPGDIANRVVNGNFLPSISDDGRYVAFSSNRDLASQNADGNLEIFIFDTVALSFTQLTNSSGTVGFSDAKISGNGALVAYIGDAGTTPSAKRDLLLQSRVGASPLRVLAAEVQSLAMTHGRAISDDATRLVWAAETARNTTQVFLFDGRSNTTRQITSLGSRATDVPLHATISGDGTRIAFATRRSFLGNSDGSVDLYSFDIPSATFGRVTSGPSTATAEVVSSLNDDGSLIAFNFPRVLSGVSNSDFANSSEIYVTGTPSRPAFGTLTVLNGASFGNEPSTTEAVAPDSIAVARGSVLANTTERSQPSANGTLPLTVGGTTVIVNGRRAQIFFASPTQVNFLVPPGTELGTAEVIVTNADGFPSRGIIRTLQAAPGVFTFSGDGLGDGVILDADTLLPAPFDPTGGNLRLIIFSTGVRNSSQVSVSAGGLALTLESIVPSPTMSGLDEVHVLVPADLRGADKVDLVIRADGRDSNPVTVTFVGDARRDIVINEFLADAPDGASGDSNKDGVRNTSDDEFVELVNTTTHDIDISGYQLLTRGTGGTGTLRHTFAQGSQGTILPACAAIVVFGGGSPERDNPAFGGAQILKASTGSLTLINAAGVITLRDPTATIVNFISYGSSTGLDADSNQSLTRAPDTTGTFSMHQSAGGSGGLPFSPGTRLNGSAFTACPPIARVEVSPLSATVEAGALQQFTARAFDAGGNEVSGVIFSWQSSDTSAATIDRNGRATTLSAGLRRSTLIRAMGRGVQSAPATLMINPPTPILTSVTISPVSATIRVGEIQQFTAQAKDQFDQNIGGVPISFSSNDTAVATIDTLTDTSATGSATATLTGQASGSAQITAAANNGSINVTSSTAILTVEPGAGQLLISEFRTRGPNGASDEFIEIYNPTLSTVTIGGLRIRASNSAGGVSDRITIPAGTTLPSGRHYLIANNTVNTGYGGAVAANQTYTTGIADDGGIAIAGSNGTTIIDSVGMSSGSAYKEGTPLAPLTNNANQSYERKPGGASGNGTDTNNNAADFLLNAAGSNPQNLDSAGLNLNTADLGVTKTDSPDPLITGSDLTYTITVTNTGPGIAQSVVVTDNLPASVTFVSCSSTAGGICGGAGNNRTIGFPLLGSGSSAVITLVATANSAGGTTIANTAIATSATPDPDPSNNFVTATSSVQAKPSILSINDVTANEGNSGTTTFTFIVSSSVPAPAGGITLDIATQDSTAISNIDYLGRSVTGQTIPAGQQTYTFDVTVSGDLLVEPNETFFVNLTNASGAIIADGQGQG
ncbi:MAG: lamin tail domain-containing protein, partial [Pyrinomonadaceae bacterium]